MLQPKITKYRKQFKGRMRGKANKGNSVKFGTYGMKSVGRGRITARQIEATRRVISRLMKAGGKIWIRIFPDKPITRKPLETRMGSGKGSVEYWVAVVRPGTVLFEVEGLTEQEARKAFKLAGAKLPVQVEFVTRTVI